MSKNPIRNLNKKIKQRLFKSSKFTNLAKVSTKLAATKELKRLNDEKQKKLTKSTTKKENNQQYVRPRKT